MKFLVLLCLSMGNLLPVFPQTAEALLQEAQRLESIPNEQAALNKYKEVLLKDGKNIIALSKCSQLYSRIGARQKNTAERDKLYAQALSYANQALALDANHDEANVSKAIVLGKSSLAKSGKEKIKSVKEIKKHVDIALKSNPNNYLAWHVLGRWNYEVSNVSALERAAAKVFYDALPKASLSNAIMYMEKSRTLNPLFILNLYELARSYDKNDQREKAKEILNSIEKIPVGTDDDPNIKLEAKKLLKSWS